jgi:hypothetical protein
MAQEIINPPLYQVHEEINGAFPAPITAGQTGSSELDLFLAASEQALMRARAQAAQLKPLISQGEANGDIYRQAVGLVSGEQTHANSFLASATQVLESRQSRAKRTFADSNPRPANVPAELIVQRIQTLQTLFDSMKSKDIMPRIEKELREGDSLNTYIIRGGEKWIAAYLESRQLKELDLIYYIKQNVGILESDLTKACDELLTLPALFVALEETRKAIQNGFFDLAMEIVGWLPKPQPFQTNSLADNAPATVGTVREMVRELMESQGKFYNPRQ